MKKIFTFLLVLIGFSFVASAQLQVDKQLQMTGTNNTDRQITNVGDPAAANDAVNAATVQRGVLAYAAATGSGGNYVVTLAPAPSAYSTGMIVNFKANHANTGAATLKVGALAAIGIKTGVTNDLSAGNIATDQMVSVIYDGSNFQLLSGSVAPASLPPSGAAGGDLAGNYPNPDIASGVVTTAEIANATITAADLATTGVGAGTYNNVTVNAQGQVTTGSNVTYLTSETDGSVTNEGSLSVGAGTGNSSLIQSNTSGSGTITLTAGNNISLSESGNEITIAANTNGTVTNVATGTGLTGGPITSTGTISLANTGVSAGTYTSVTVNAQGQVTGGSNPGFTTGTGANGHVTYWTGATTQSYDSDGNFFWDAASNNLGIGTGSPGYRLDVAGDARIGSSRTLLISSATASRTNLRPAVANGDITITDDSGNPERGITVANGGNLGIGIATPDNALHIRRNGSTPVIQIFSDRSGSSSGPAQLMESRILLGGVNNQGWNTANGAGIDFTVNYNSGVSNSDKARLNFWTYPSSSASPNFTIWNGNAGIGTTSPGYRLDVAGDVNFTSTVKMSGVNVLHGNTNDVYVNARVIRNESAGAQDGMYIGYQSTGGTGAHLRFFANSDVQRMFISAADGNVGIATGSPTEKLDVNGNIRISSDAATASGAYLDWRRASDGWNPARIMANWSGSNWGGIINFMTNTGGSASDLSTKMTLLSDGSLKVTNLSASGTVPVFADNNGTLMKGASGSTYAYSEVYPVTTDNAASGSTGGAFGTTSTSSTQVPGSSVTLGAGTWQIYASAEIDNSWDDTWSTAIALYDATNGSFLASAIPRNWTWVPWSCVKQVTISGNTQYQIRVRSNSSGSTAYVRNVRIMATKVQ